MGFEAVLCQVLSYSVVALSGMMQFPQVWAIFITGDTMGVNLRSNWMDVSACLIGFFYGYSYGYPLRTYLEAGLISIQLTSIVLMVIYYKRKWTVENYSYFVVLLAFSLASLLGLVPLFVMTALLSLTLPLSVVSKLLQIRTLYQMKSRGSLSVLTWALILYCCSARLVTVYLEVDDKLLFLNLSVNVLLIIVILALCLYYGDGSEKQKTN